MFFNFWSVKGGLLFLLGNFNLQSKFIWGFFQFSQIEKFLTKFLQINVTQGILRFKNWLIVQEKYKIRNSSCTFT